MKNLILIISLMIFCNSCSNKDSLGEEFVFSGKAYRDCVKTFTNRNTPLEVVLKNQGLGGSKTKVLATTTTDENGHFSLKFKVNKREEVNLVIPANSSINLYSPIDILNFNRGQGIDEEEDIRSMENTDFYVTPLVDVKIRLVTSRTYTNQDTLYYSGLKGETVPYMIIAPISNQVIDFKNVYSKFKEGAAAYGIGFAEYKKSVKSGVSYWHVDFGSKVGHIIPPTFMF